MVITLLDGGELLTMKYQAGELLNSFPKFDNNFITRRKIEIFLLHSRKIGPVAVMYNYRLMYVYYFKL
jgi:hypothetical protein